MIRGFFGEGSGPIFIDDVVGTNRDLNVSEKTELIESLLLDKELRTVLSTKFCAYWKPRTMVEQLHHVAKVMYEQKSTLNIADSIHCIIKSAFFDYIVVMFRKLIANHVIDMLIKKDCSSAFWCLNQ